MRFRSMSTSTLLSLVMVAPIAAIAFVAKGIGADMLLKMQVSRVLFITPALPRLRPSPPAGDGWLFELKFDGWRSG
jgi:ATP-dependent DNA ligase